MRKKSILFVLLALWVALLAACAPTAQPEKTVEKFFQAVSSKDSTTVSAVSCKDWEKDALLILDSFQAVTTTLEGLSCEQVSSDPDGRVIVGCAGKLVASYDGELQEFDLSVQQFIVEKVSGEWLICGTK